MLKIYCLMIFSVVLIQETLSEKIPIHSLEVTYKLWVAGLNPAVDVI